MSRRSMHGLPLLAVFVMVLPSSGVAIEIAPTPAQIQGAIDRGKQAAQQRTAPDRLYTWFGGTGENEPKGFLMTKLSGLAVMATHFHLRSATPDEMEIAQILEGTTLLVSTTIFGEKPTFAQNSYMVLDQSGKTVKPVNVRFDGQAARSSVWPASPAYRAKVVASFAYVDFDPKAQTKLSVFPSEGGQVTFDLDFSRIE